MDHLKLADKETIEQHYQGVVQSYANCHQAMCPGPLAKINKMYIMNESGIIETLV